MESQIQDLTIDEAIASLGTGRVLFYRYLNELNIQPHPVARVKQRYLSFKEVERVQAHINKQEKIKREQYVALSDVREELGISMNMQTYHLNALNVKRERFPGSQSYYISLKDKQRLVENLRQHGHKRQQTGEKIEQRAPRYAVHPRKRNQKQLEQSGKFSQSELEPIDQLARGEVAFIFTVRLAQERKGGPYEHVSDSAVTQMRDQGRFDSKYLRVIPPKLATLYDKHYILHDAPLPFKMALRGELKPSDMANWIRDYPRALHEMQRLGWHIPYLEEAQEINRQRKA